MVMEHSLKQLSTDPALLLLRRWWRLGHGPQRSGHGPPPCPCRRLQLLGQLQILPRPASPRLLRGRPQIGPVLRPPPISGRVRLSCVIVGPKSGADLEPAPQEPGRSRARRDLKLDRQLKVLAGAGRGTVAATLRPTAQPPPAPQRWKSQIDVAATVPRPAPAGAFNCRSSFRSHRARLLPGSCGAGSRSAQLFGPPLISSRVRLSCGILGPKRPTAQPPQRQKSWMR
uniref:Uncharacterized protein n=1 Tax=Sphaerodactylus townsendi TaxID=933632 RepID=A0ACB8GDM4_9SAUR